MTFRWLSREAVKAIHEEQIAEHGGHLGMLDANALEAALARPVNKLDYGEPDHAELAAAYLYGITTRHPFADGNKRVGLLAAYAFLQINGYELVADNGEAYVLVAAVAAGEIDEAGIALWLRDNIKPLVDYSE